MFGGKQIGFSLFIISVSTIFITNLIVAHPFNQATLANILVSLSATAAILSSFSAKMINYIEQLDKQKSELDYLANKDPFTEVLNSKIHDELTSGMLKKVKYEQQHLSLIYLDIDNFNQVKNKYSNEVAEDVMLHIIQLINGQLTGEDIMAHVCGEQFFIFLPDKDQLSAQSLALKIKQAVHSDLYTYEKNKIVLTLSMGLATLHESDNGIRSLQIRADKALVKAKILGGNVIKSAEATCY